MSMTEEAIDKEEILKVAMANGRYLLPRISGTKTEKACRELVESGHAEWLSQNSTYYPGIRPTGKPWEDALKEHAK